MYYIERIPLTNAAFLAGSVAEPSASETEWVSGGTYAVGTERIRSSLHRVFKCAVARSPSTTPPSTTPPEEDATGWVDMRATDRWVPFGPMQRADGKVVYESRALESTTTDIEYRLALRYANAAALFGLRGVAWRAQVYSSPGGPLVAERTGTLKVPATGYWDYAYGMRKVRDRVLITDLPIFPNAELRITVQAGAGQLRRLSQLSVGKLRFLPGVSVGGPGCGVEYGLRRIPRAYTYQKEEPDGSSTTLLYGTTYDQAGRIALNAENEDAVLMQLRNLIGQGAAFAPTLLPGYEQSLLFGTLETGEVSRDSAVHSSVDFRIKGLPT